MQKKFDEAQKIDSIWPLGILALTLAGNWLLYFILKHDDLSFFYISILSIGLLCLFISSIKLNIEIYSDTIRYKMFPFHFKFNEIKTIDITKMEVRTYKPFSEYGGWGNRRGKSGRAYTVRGNVGLQLVLKNGQKILLGTAKPDEVAIAIKS